jgi:catechol 2,3-dioxygenase-like lactoylglutathione lyase family enzyme
MIGALDAVEVITLFVEDVEAAKAFYQGVFASPIVFQDDVSAVFRLRNVLLNVLHVSQAPEVIAPAAVAKANAGARLLLTIEVEDANAVCTELERHGVRLLNGPVDRPWGRRTAAFSDPAGNLWEIAQKLPARGADRGDSK